MRILFPLLAMNLALVSYLPNLYEQVREFGENALAASTKLPSSKISRGLSNLGWREAFEEVVVSTPGHFRSENGSSEWINGSSAEVNGKGEPFATYQANQWATAPTVIISHRSRFLFESEFSMMTKCAGFDD